VKHTIIHIDIATLYDFDPYEPPSPAFHSLIQRIDRELDNWMEEFEDWKFTVTHEERDI